MVPCCVMAFVCENVLYFYSILNLHHCMLQVILLFSIDRARYNDGYRGRSSSRSPDRAPSGRGRSPVRSFHQAMMERGRSSPTPQHKSPFRERSRSPLGGRRNFGNSFEDQLGLRRSSGGRDDGYGDEEEEGMIRPE